MKCLIIDDEPTAIEILRDYVEKVPFLECAGTFRDPLKALNFIQKNPVDLILLDINMPDLTGIQFLKSLESQPLVIFTTAYSKYALESYDYDAVDYLLKPIEFDRFLKAINKAFKQYQIKTSRMTPFIQEGDFILIKSGTEYYKIKLNDILYIRGTGNYVTFVTKKKEILSLLTMKAVSEMLSSKMFFRIHKSYIVNFSHVDLIESDQLKINEEYLPIGDYYRETIFNAIKQK
ncbi:MAG: response regulator transcription factor [Candidatus Aminicenantes bacterium]|nr:MAG: response regulator transcription factor [Candidatus Aminicenantes bacterium]